MKKTVNGELFARMIIHASALLNQQKQQINELNVFPVPDGDTGTNMSLTVSTAASELKRQDPKDVGKAASVTASAMLRGARGNSGVILSLLFRGLSKGLRDKEEMNGADFAEALKDGVSAAYGAVMKPAEGTILTVSRLGAERAVEAAEKNPAIEYVLSETIKASEAALAETINQNPVLKKAGVVDAGGKGFVTILLGMMNELKGKKMPRAEAEEKAPAEQADWAALSEEDITFTYDTVFVVRYGDDHNLKPFRAYLESIGDSLVIGEDDEVFKVHVHTDTPGLALTEAAKYGTLELAKIENMRTQAQAIAAGKKAISTDDLEAIEEELESQESAAPAAAKEAPAELAGEEERWVAAPEKKYGFVTVCAGEGLAAVFADLGCDGVISGGQTMNPSTADIMKVIDHTPAEIVFVLPNNKNIVMAAQQCIPLCEEKQVIVVPTSTIPQGIAAMMAVDPDASPSEISGAMMESMKSVRTSQITYAARDSDIDGFDIHAGDYLALQDGALFGTRKDLAGLLDALAKNKPQQEAEFITLFYGSDVNEETAAMAKRIFTENCPDADINLIAGGQPVYYFMISAE